MREVLSRETHLRVVKSFNETFGTDVDIPRLNKGEGDYGVLFLEALKANGFRSTKKANEAIAAWSETNGFDF